MKKYIVIACGLLTAMYAQSALTVSRTVDIPTNDIVVSQTNVVEGLKIYTSQYSSTKLRGVGQSFKWTSDSDVTQMGFKIYNGLSTWVDQDYVLTILEVDTNGFVQGTVYQEEFLLAEGDVYKREWVNLDFDDVNLVNGDMYAFMLSPQTNEFSSQILYFAQDATGANPYTEGVAVQSSAGAGVTYFNPTRLNDITFYLQSVTPGAPIEEWRMEYFGTTNNVGDAADDNDYMGDGYPNLVKYTLGLIPTNNYDGSPIAPYSAITNGLFTYTFTFDTTVTDATLMAEGTGDLVANSWVDIDPLDPANQVSVLDDTPEVGLQTITIKDTQPNADARFMRLKTTRP